MFSGLACVLAPARRFTASACACHLEGAKSPLRVHSLLSTHTTVASRLMLVCDKTGPQRNDFDELVELLTMDCANMATAGSTLFYHTNL